HTRKEYARGEVHENRAECLFSLLKPYLRVFRGLSKTNLPGYLGFFQFLRNFRAQNAFGQAELILQAVLIPSIAHKTRRGVDSSHVLTTLTSYKLLEIERLDVPYVHVVFTLPHTLSPLAIQNPRVLSTLRLQAVAETLLTVARDPHHLGAEIGLLAVLHTWGQTLHHHPHLHCVVPGGGLSPDGTQWRGRGPTLLLPRRGPAQALPPAALSATH